MSNSFNIKNLIDQSQFQEIEVENRFNYLNKIINEGEIIDDFNASKSIRFSFFLFNLVLSKLEEPNRNVSLAEDELKDLESIYYQLRAIDIANTTHSDEFETIWGIDTVPTESVYFFYLATVGLLSKNSIKVRIDLFDYNYVPSTVNSSDWKTTLLNKILAGITLLIRKKNGLADAEAVIAIVNNLKLHQQHYEEVYLNNLELSAKVPNAVELLGLYHLTKVLIETATYLVQGYGYKGNLSSEIARHSKYAREALTNSPRLFSLIPIIERACIEVQRNSIWFSTINLGSSIVDLCKNLAQIDKIDLLPSQQEAISKNLLDAASSATIVTMPTSAGKTLLAEFCILQTKALNPNTKIVYLVPTRALVNQVVSDLRTDFEGLNLSIEKTSKVNEIDPTEDVFLQEEIDILVSTPEKFDLMLRRKHPSVENVSFIIVDEAHNIKEGDRGAKLELLLSIIKREKPTAKFLLLSPFIPNANSLKEWLAGGKNAISPIQVLWKPSDKVIMGLRETGGTLQMVVEPSAYSFLQTTTQKILPIGRDFELTETRPKDRLFEAATHLFGGNKNSILFLCWGKGTADSKADKLSNYVGNQRTSELQELVSKFIEEEVGEVTTLSRVVKKGIGIHHAGLTEDTKILVEHLIKKAEIKYICATTTIAQGINFPISTVYIDDTRKGRGGRLSINEFLNIAGRAGRTLVDNVGKIIFPYNSPTSIRNAHNLISQQSLSVSSALTELILQAENIIKVFAQHDNAQQRAQLFDTYKSLGVLVQYLIHLLNVSEEFHYRDELEELFKDSFGYFTLQGQERANFLKICETLYIDLQNRNRGVLKFADKTGFSVPSILSIMRAKSDMPEISSPESWDADNLFSTGNEYLKKKIEVIGTLREAKLGTDAGSAPFNPELVANILKGWVNGDNLSEISFIHPFFKEKADGDRINDFINYLTETTFKSSWGLSALEGIVKASGEEIAENTHIPSLLYYGVNNKASIPYRMVGIPRNLAGNFSQYFNSEEPSSFRQLRQRIQQLSVRQWDELKPSTSSLSGEEWKNITGILLKNQ